MQQIQMAEAKTHFSALIGRVETGEEIIIARRGKAVARLIPEPKVTENALDVFRATWMMVGLDISSPPELPFDLDAVNLD